MTRLAATAPERDRTLLIRVVCSACGVTVDVDPKDDRDCVLCTGVGTLERVSVGGHDG